MSKQVNTTELVKMNQPCSATEYCRELSRREEALADADREERKAAAEALRVFREGAPTITDDDVEGAESHHRELCLMRERFEQELEAATDSLPNVNELEQAVTAAQGQVDAAKAAALVGDGKQADLKRAEDGLAAATRQLDKARTSHQEAERLVQVLERKLEWAAEEAEAADEELRAMCRLLGESRHQDALGRIRAVLEGKDMQFAFGDLCSAREYLRLAGLLDDDGAPVFRVSTLWPREFGCLPEMAEVTITAPKPKD